MLAKLEWLSMEKIITDGNFREVTASADVVLVDFWAPWCGPCRMLGPTIEEIAGEYAGKAVVAKCNVDDCPNVSAAMRIEVIPTLVYFKGGRPVNSTVGVRPKAEITGALDELLAR